jgi:hypothetical protein
MVTLNVRDLSREHLVPRGMRALPPQLFSGRLAITS